jgi:ribosomal protein L11 methyltransferase
VRRFFVALGRLSSHAGKARLNWQVVDAEKWNESWKRFIKPQRVGKSFWVTPPWLEPPKFRRRQVITIEPGMAFGTGTHATTRGCLEFLEVAADRLRDDKFTALDVGTGSGILAIALDKLGAREVWAIDNDPVALKVARENLIVNQAAEKVHLTGKNLSAIRKTFSLVVANLTAETILELAEALERKVARKGFLILSGILQKRVSAVTRRFAARFRTVKRKRAREWAILLLQRK